MSPCGVATGSAEAGQVNTWKQFVANIPRLAALPVRCQAGNTCAQAAAVTAWEVQHDAVFKQPLSALGGYAKLKRKGGFLGDQIDRVWGRAGANRPQRLGDFRGRWGLGGWMLSWLIG